jgi:cysteine-rich repeat protein
MEAPSSASSSSSGVEASSSFSLPSSLELPSSLLPPSSFGLSSSLSLPSSFGVPSSYLPPSSFGLSSSLSLPSSFEIPSSYLPPSSFGLSSSLSLPSSLEVSSSYLPPSSFEVSSSYVPSSSLGLSSGYVDPSSGGGSSSFYVPPSSGLPAHCGDAEVNTAEEECDDGNTILADGCYDCKLEPTEDELTAIRQAIHHAAASPVTLNHPVTHGLVTYVKVGQGTSGPGHVDGPGFFVQNGPFGPALFFAMDPAVVAADLAPGDVVDLTVTKGEWLSCLSASCTADNSMYVVTGATGSVVGNTTHIAATQDVTNDPSLSAPVVNGPLGWDLENELVTVMGMLHGDWVNAGGVFKKIQVLRFIDNSPSPVFLRVPTSLIAEAGLVADCTVMVTHAPIWRYESEAQVSAWSHHDVIPVQCPALTVAVSPPDGVPNVPAPTDVVLAFSAPVDPATLTAQTTRGGCQGSVQVTRGAPDNCLPFASATPVMSQNNTVATFTPAPGFAFGATYKVRVTDAVRATNGNQLVGGYQAANGFTTMVMSTSTPVCNHPQPGSVVISQVYGGGGNSGALYKSDFVELHNRGSVAVTMTAWSIQYAGASGTFPYQTSGTMTVFSGTIAAGGFFLVKMADGAGGTQNLPSPDASGTIAMSGTAGKVALVSNATPISPTQALATQCPATTALVDVVGYGTVSYGASCPVAPASSAPGTTNATSVIRLNNGCDQTGNNGVDFTTSNPPTPRNSESVHDSICPCANLPTLNETGDGAELDWCVVQWPPELAVAAGGTSTERVWGRVSETGVTDVTTVTPDARITVELGWGPLDVNPQNQSGWTWTTLGLTSFNSECGDCGSNNDEYGAYLSVPASTLPGRYAYGYRFSFNGMGWTYCDLDGAGSSATDSFDPLLLPVLTVSP